jgi:acyl carrier protein
MGTEFNKKALFELMEDILKINNIDENKTMNEIPEWDSLKHIQLLSAIERKFDIRLNFEDSLSMIDVKGIINIILSKIN